jgi:hypothetical protein
LHDFCPHTSWIPHPRYLAPFPTCSNGLGWDKDCVSGSIWWLDNPAFPPATVNGDKNFLAC